MFGGTVCDAVCASINAIRGALFIPRLVYPR